MDVLRTFVAGQDLGGYGRAAERLGRSASAVSLQLRKLEEQAGRPLLRRSGRGLALTEAGETMLVHARRLLRLNDEAVAALRDERVSGWVRLGLPQDFAEAMLPAVLARFAAEEPRHRLEVRADGNAALARALAAGEIDLALAWAEEGAGREGWIADEPMRWIGRRDGALPPDLDRLVPLAAFAAPCLFARSATRALEQAGRPFRQVFTSPGLSGLHAAVSAGLGLTARTRHGLPEALAPLEAAAPALPPLPRVGLVLHRGRDAPPAAARLAGLVAETLRAG